MAASAFAALSIAVFGIIFSQQTSPIWDHGSRRHSSRSRTLVLAYLRCTPTSQSFYPTRVGRAVGFTYGFSRLSTIFIPFMIAFCLRNYGTIGVFAFIASAMVLVFFIIAIMGPKTTRLRLEAISR